MASTALERVGLAGLALATQITKGFQRAPKVRSKARAVSPVDDPPSDQVLGQLIESEIIPRLMLLSGEASAKSRRGVTDMVGAPVFTPQEVDRFALNALQSEPAELIAQIELYLDRGASQEDILLSLLAPAARRLGVMWDEDICDFTEVTIGLMKLHRVLRRLSADATVDMAENAGAPGILLGSAEGEQHVFGLLILSEMFTRSGWRVRCDPDCRPMDLETALAEEYFDVVGLAASTDNSLSSLKPMIRRMRKNSVNADVMIMVGGPAFQGDPGLARRVGADATAIDGVGAVVTAERVVHRLDRMAGAVRQ